MRIIKACDACKRKKIRCDPSHKKRTAPQTQSSRAHLPQTMKAKMATHESPTIDFSVTTPSSAVSIPSFEAELAAANSFEGLNENPDDFWQQFVHFDNQAISLPEDYDSFLNPAGYVTSSNGSSSASPSHSFIPSTPALPHNYGVLPDLQEPALPYLHPGDSHGTNYQDFNLYSPASDLLDEEPQSVGKPHRRGWTSEQDNLLESNYQQTAHDPPYSDGDTYLSSGQNHQHGHVLETSLPDWPQVNAGLGRAPDPGYSTGVSHQLLRAADPVKDYVGDVNEQPRPLPSPSFGAYQRPPVARLSYSPGDQVRPLFSAAQTPALAVPTAAGLVTAPARLQQVTSTFVNAQLYTSRAMENAGSATVSQQGRYVCADTVLPDLVHTPTSQRVQVPDGPISDALSEDLGQAGFAPLLSPTVSLAARRALFVRSAFVLEPNDYHDVAVSGLTTSVLTSGSGLDGSVVNKGTYGQRANSGLREAPHAHFVGWDAIMPTLADTRASSVPASLLAASSTSRSGALQKVHNQQRPLSGLADHRATSGASLERHKQYPDPQAGSATSQPSWLAPVAVTLRDSVMYGLVVCLLVSFMQWAGVGWQVELMFALSFSPCLRPSYEHKPDVFRSPIKEVSGPLRRPLRNMSAWCLAGP